MEWGAVATGWPTMDPPEQGYWRRLVHRWFVEYNPLYLVSAAFVLVGAHLLSSALEGSAFLLVELGPPAIAELYGWALIGGAALLTRIGLWRPAVMIALLAALYQCDVTLHTEHAVFLGVEGRVAGAVWWLSFVAKLFTLCWAMGVKASRSAWLIPSVAALGMVIVPHQLRYLHAHTASMLVGGWVFAVLAAGLWTARHVTSREPLDPWGRTVFSRVTRSIWALWATLFVGHVLFWCWDLGISPRSLLPVCVLLATRFVRREASVWAMSLATVVLVAASMPSLTSFTFLLVSVTLGLRAWREPRHSTACRKPRASDPYRASHPSADANEPPPVRVSFRHAARAARARLMTGSGFSFYFATWTLGWSGQGGWPEHHVALDLTLTLVVGTCAWFLRRRLLLVGLVGIHLHHGVVVGIIGLPSTPLSWGVALISTGFAMLIATLALSYRWQRRAGIDTSK